MDVLPEEDSKIALLPLLWDKVDGGWSSKAALHIASWRHKPNDDHLLGTRKPQRHLGMPVHYTVQSIKGKACHSSVISIGRNIGLAIWTSGRFHGRTDSCSLTNNGLSSPLPQRPSMLWCLK